MSNLLKWYQRSMDTRPLLTKMVGCGILAGLGDLFCQNLEKSKKILSPHSVSQKKCQKKIRLIGRVTLG